MKPIRLVIAGLNSFKEQQEIDFTKLCQGNVFGIFGPTGSGKSTIVDAITLALYGSVKRASRKTQGIVNKALTEASVLFEFQLGSAAARKHYRVERKYVAKDDSVNCRLARLSEIQGEEVLVLADKPSQVDQAIEEILGLTEDDFTRAVVLPQGHFAEFLNLQGSERRRMLERIFGLEEYGEQLNRVVSERLKTAETNLQGIERSQDLLGDATDKAVQAAKQLEQDTQAELAVRKTAAEKMRAERERWGRVRERQQELEQAQVALSKLQQQASSISDLEAKLERQEAAQRIASSLQAFDQATDRATQATTALQQRLAAVAAAEGNSQQAQQAAAQALQDKQEQEEPLLQKIEQLERALALEQQVDTLEHELAAKAKAGQGLTEQLRAAEQALLALQANIATVEAKREAGQLEQEQNRILPEQRQQLAAAMAIQEGYLAVMKQLQATATDARTRQEQLARVQQQLASAKKQLAASTAAEAQQQQLLDQLLVQAPANVTSEQLTTANTYLKEAQQLIQDGGHFKQQQEAVAKLEAAIEELQQQLGQAAAQVAVAEEAVADNEGAVSQLEQSLTAAREQHMAALLAQNLTPGQPCPVCGSHEHPAPSPSGTAANDQLEQIAAALAAARAGLAQRQASHATAQAALAAHEVGLQRQRLALATSNEQLQIYTARVEEQLSKFPAEWVGNNEWSAIPSLAQTYLTELSQQFSQRAAWQTELETSQAALAAAANLTRQQQQQVELLLQARANQQTELARLATGQQALQAEAEGKQAELARRLASLSEPDLATARSRYQERDARLAELELLLKQLQSEKETLLQQMRQLEQTMGQLKEQQAEARADYRLHQAQLQDLRQELLKLTAGARAADLQQAAQLTLATLRAQATRAQAAWEGTKEKLASAQQDLSAGQEASRLANTARAQAEATLLAALEREQFVTRQAAEEALSWADLAAEWQQTINNRKKQLEFWQRRQAELVELQAGLAISDAEWQELAWQAQVAEEQHLQAVEALATAQASLANVVERYQQWVELEEERQQLAQEKDLLGELVSLLRGNALVEFMAGEHLDAIAGIASSWLGLLTGQRYALEVAPDGGFLIRDDGNGGAKRPVATLSGGETFITSLALALALSSQIQLRGKYRLEFFFLDEGFGSLDPDLLEVVMSCLERMQGQAMSIGIISHVPELQERIMRQVAVTPAQLGGQGSRVQVTTG